MGVQNQITNPIYKTLHLVGYHICCLGADKHVYKHLHIFYNTEMPLNPKQNFTTMRCCLHLKNVNGLLQHNIYILQ